jgi:D-alanyl-D-alanine carboxypeptidase/D-alanyl-D-alanine-endopeptidase (penicillin-binding protein 4)
MSVPDPVLADHVVFSGTFPAACHSYTLFRSVLQPHTYAYGAFKLLWAQWGGDIQGTVRLGKVPDSAQRLLTWQSRPLGESVRAVNKWSNNVMTRLLLYSIALAKYDAPVTREQGVEVIHEYLQANNLDDTGLVIDNGSGLSRDTRITGTLMSQLLRHAYHSRFMPEFIASMSIAGLDGTTRRRFKGKPEAGQMHLKTGRLDDVAAIAGYVVAASGKTYSVVLLANSQNIHNGPGIELQNTLLQWVYRQ